MMSIAMKRFNLKPSRSLMIGDRLDTDIVFAQNAKVDQLLVMTGITTPKILTSKSNSIQPTYIISGVAALFGDSQNDESKEA